MKKQLLRVAIGIAATGAAIATTAGVASAAPIGDTASIVDAQPAASSSAESSPRCTGASPSEGWVIFYSGWDCGGADYQGWAACGWHDFTGNMVAQTNSYIDNQVNADADAYVGVTGEHLFNTLADNKAHNVPAGAENKATQVHLNC